MKIMLIFATYNLTFAGSLCSLQTVKTRMGTQDIEINYGYDLCKQYRGLQLLYAHQQIKELQTILRDK